MNGNGRQLSDAGENVRLKRPKRPKSPHRPVWVSDFGPRGCDEAVRDTRLFFNPQVSLF
jgi:hypothetical protein